MWSWRAVHLVLSLATDFVDGCLICELRDELIGLDIDVLFAWGSFGRLDVAGEEFFGSLSALLL